MKRTRKEPMDLPKYQMRLDEGEWVVHDPATGADAVIRMDNGEPVPADRFKLARHIAIELFGEEIVLV